MCGRSSQSPSPSQTFTSIASTGEDGSERCVSHISFIRLFMQSFPFRIQLGCESAEGFAFDGAGAERKARIYLHSQRRRSTNNPKFSEFYNK